MRKYMGDTAINLDAGNQGQIAFHAWWTGGAGRDVGAAGSKQGAVPGQGAAVKCSVPEWGLRHSCISIYRRPATGPKQSHPLFKPLCSPCQDGAICPGAAGCHPGPRAQQQVAQGTRTQAVTDTGAEICILLFRFDVAGLKLDWKDVCFFPFGMIFFL